MKNIKNIQKNIKNLSPAVEAIRKEIGNKNFLEIFIHAMNLHAVHLFVKDLDSCSPNELAVVRKAALSLIENNAVGALQYMNK